MRCNRTGKHMFATPQAAFSGAHAMQKSEVQRGRQRVKRFVETEKLHHYRCEFCKGWHVGRRNGEQVNP